MFSKLHRQAVSTFLKPCDYLLPFLLIVQLIIFTQKKLACSIGCHRSGFIGREPCLQIYSKYCCASHKYLLLGQVCHISQVLPSGYGLIKPITWHSKSGSCCPSNFSELSFFCCFQFCLCELKKILIQGVLLDLCSTGNFQTVGFQILLVYGQEDHIIYHLNQHTFECVKEQY